MSRWHRDNPELYEQGYEPWDDLMAEADNARKAEREGSLSEPDLYRGMHATAKLRGEERHDELEIARERIERPDG